MNSKKPGNKKDAEKVLEGVYSTEYEAEGEYREIETNRLVPFSCLPFHMYSDDEMTMMRLSIQLHGVMTPIIVRPLKGEDSYEIVSGYQRVDACMRSGIQTIPCIVREMDDQDAMICMIDSNLQQRTELTPSEKAKAYKLKAEAYQQKRENGVPVGLRKTRDLVGMEGCDSGAQVQRYLRLNKLIPEFQKKVDNATMCMRAGVELSYLSPAEQKTLWEAMLKEQVSPSTEQAKSIRKLSGSDAFTIRNLRAVLTGKEIEPEGPAKTEAAEPRKKSVALLAPDVSKKAVLPDATGQEDVEEPALEEEPTAAEDVPPAPERVIRFPWSALAPYFSEEMTDVQVEQAILSLLQQYGKRRESAAPWLVALP